MKFDFIYVNKGHDAYNSLSIEVLTLQQNTFKALPLGGRFGSGRTSPVKNINK